MAGLGAMLMAGGSGGTGGGGLAGVVKQVASQLGGLVAPLAKLGAQFGSLKNTILETVGAFRPFAVVQFTRAMLDLKAVFGSIFLPILNEATSIVRMFANYMLSLPSTFKDVIRELVKLNLISGAVVVIGGLITAFSVLLAPINAVVGAIRYLVNLFRSTEGGASALGQAIRNVEDYFAGWMGSLKAAWNATASARAELRSAFNEAGKAMSKLYTELRPILAAILGVGGMIIKYVLMGIIRVVTVIVKLTTALYQAVSKLIGPLSRLLKAFGVDLPDTSRKTRDAFGMGHSGASVSDPLSVYNKLSEELMRSSRDGAKPDEVTADATNHMSDIMDKIAPKFEKFLDDAAKVFQLILAMGNPGNAMRQGFNQLFGP